MRYLSFPRIFWACLLLAAAIWAGLAYFQLWLGLMPCKLCLYQRVPWMIVPGVAAIGLLMGKRLSQPAHLLLIALIMASLLVGAAIASYHAGVEYQWWAGPSGCTGATALPGGLADLQAALAGPAAPRCDEIPWSLFGLSMAGYNAIISAAAALLLASILICHRTQRRA